MSRKDHQNDISALIPKEVSSRLNLAMDAAGLRPAMVYKSLGWDSPKLSNFRAGRNRIRDVEADLLGTLIGFDTLWLYTGKLRGIPRLALRQKVVALLREGWTDPLKEPRLGKRGRPPESRKAK